jgi:hypothetical protein
VSRTIRGECLDYLIPLSEQHLRRIVAEFVDYYNHDLPQRNICLQAVSEPTDQARCGDCPAGPGRTPPRLRLSSLTGLTFAALRPFLLRAEAAADGGWRLVPEAGRGGVNPAVS